MIGRDHEVKQLKKLYNSNKAHLVAVYGRRRVGKTYLINQALKGHITFNHTGLSPLDNTKKGMLAAQLEHFYYSLVRIGMPEGKKPESWLEAFYMLEMHLEKKIPENDRWYFSTNCRGWIPKGRDFFLHLRHFGTVGDAAGIILWLSYAAVLLPGCSII